MSLRDTAYDPLSNIWPPAKPYLKYDQITKLILNQALPQASILHNVLSSAVSALSSIFGSRLIQLDTLWLYAAVARERSLPGYLLLLKWQRKSLCHLQVRGMLGFAQCLTNGWHHACLTPRGVPLTIFKQITSKAFQIWCIWRTWISTKSHKLSGCLALVILHGWEWHTCVNFWGVLPDLELPRLSGWIHWKCWTQALTPLLLSQQ